jgi:hypothetical protein
MYGGSAGGGKSFLMRAMAIFVATAIPGALCYLFRRHYQDLIKNHGIPLREMLAPWVQSGLVEIIELEIRFWNGSRIFLCHCNHDKDVYNYQGAEIHFLGIEEATQFTEHQIRYLRSRVRMPSSMYEAMDPAYRSQYPRILYTANPGGPSHSYFKKWFIEGAKPLEIWTPPDSEGGLARQFIPARLTDNPSLNAEEYRIQLRGLGSPQLVKAMEDGDWNAIVGSFFEILRPELHVCEDFTPPAGLTKYRVFDWGSYAPFCVLWFCVSDGTPIISHKGNKLWFPRGALIVYREWYGMIPHEPNKGLAMRNEDIAAGIKQRSTEPDIEPVILTDSLPFQDRGGQTIAKTFRDCGLTLMEGDTSRIPGWSQVLSRLKGDERGPGLHFVESCEHTLRTGPMLMRSLKKPDDVDDGQEDHAWDCVRLGCMAKPIVQTATKVQPENVAQDFTFDAILKRIQQQNRGKGNGY